jgi:hypothetical protein
MMRVSKNGCEQFARKIPQTFRGAKVWPTCSHRGADDPMPSELNVPVKEGKSVRLRNEAVVLFSLLFGLAHFCSAGPASAKNNPPAATPGQVLWELDTKG